MSSLEYPPGLFILSVIHSATGQYDDFQATEAHAEDVFSHGKR